MKVRAEGIVEPVLVGDKAKIEALLAKMGVSVPAEDLYDAPEFKDSAALAVQLVFLAVSALVLARRYFSTQGLPKPEDPFDGLPS